MKKILMFVVLCSILCATIFGTYAEYKGQPVFKIYSYSYNAQNKMYDLESYGSAIYLGDKKIITNDHVVKDRNKGYNNYFEICETRDFKKAPVCFTSAKLLYVDQSKDLAYLELADSPETQNKVSFSSDALELGDKIQTYGYPSNGGNTITFTSGKVSGFSAGRYKIDASIDSGSSGGGAFNNQGDLLGITTSVVNGYTTLGYIVPSGEVLDFIQKKGEITNVQTKYYSNFRSYLKEYQKSISSNNIFTDFIEVKNIDLYGYSIYEHLYDSSKSIDKYFLESKSGNTTIELSNGLSNGVKSRLTKGDWEKLSQILGLKSITYQYINMNGEEYGYSLSYDKKLKYIVISFTKYDVTYRISGNLKFKSELQNAVLMLIEKTQMKQKTKINKNISLAGLTIQSESGFSIGKYLNNENEMSFQAIRKAGANTIINIVGKVLKFEKPKEIIDLKERVVIYKKSFGGKQGLYSDVFITQDNNIFFYTKTNNGKMVSYVFESIKELNGNLYSYNFIVSVYGADNIDNEIKQLLNNVSFEGKNITSNKEIKESGIKRLSQIHFSNVGSYSETRNKLVLEITKQQALATLQSIVGKKYIIKSGQGSSLEDELKQSENKLSKSRTGKKYISKINQIIPKLSSIKLKKVLNKLNNIDFNSKRIAKYKDILSYIKYKILVELKDRN